MKRLHYILVPAFYLGIFLAGRAFTSAGTWYQSLVKPAVTPPGAVIGMVWTVIYILSASAFILYMNRSKNAAPFLFRAIVGLFILNGILNALWSYLFFSRHLLGLAAADALGIFLSTGLIMVLAWPASRITSLLLLPYVCWTGFATYLTYEIYRLNAPPYTPGY